MRRTLMQTVGGFARDTAPLTQSTRGGAALELSQVASACALSNVSSQQSSLHTKPATPHPNPTPSTIHSQTPYQSPPSRTWLPQGANAACFPRSESLTYSPFLPHTSAPPQSSILNRHDSKTPSANSTFSSLTASIPSPSLTEVSSGTGTGGGVDAGGGGSVSGGEGANTGAVNVNTSSSSDGASSMPLLVYQSEAIAKLTPSAVVERLDRFIIGQQDAKKAVAVAFRNRWRRHRVAESLKEDITPKNILLIGPTGCGKTEIARRLAKLADAPFIKVEATKFTEVGYHGRDVDSIIKDLVEASITLVRTKLKEQAQAAINEAVEKRLLALLVKAKAGVPAPPSVATTSSTLTHLEMLRQKLRDGELEGATVEVEVPVKPLDLSSLQGGPQTMLISLDRIMAGAGGKKERRQMTVREARETLEDQEADSKFPAELITKEAIRLAEQDGIVFIDEIDKVVSDRKSRHRSGDPSSEGVQRDLLPIIEGSTVNTKHGNVNTDHMLFICSGAFHSSKPSDLMAELQGRLPIRVELKALTQHDFYRILTEPQYNLIKQQQMLLSTEGVELHFTDAAIHEIARLAEEINRTTDNIGARRLASVLERCVEQISFTAPELAARAKSDGKDRHSCVVDKENVSERVAIFLEKQNLSKWII